VTAIPRRRQLELQYEGKSFNRDISLDISSVATPSLHVKGEILKEGELVAIKDSSTKGWFLSEVLRVLPNLVESQIFHDAHSGA
jgi:hypothetical protein